MTSSNTPDQVDPNEKLPYNPYVKDLAQSSHKKNPKYWKPYYFRVFEKIDWFRGNDEYLGMICDQCIKDGKLRLVNKFHPNQLKADEMGSDLVLKDPEADDSTHKSATTNPKER